MSLIATWFSEGRRAQHPPVPRYPLRICRWRVRGRQYGAACVARPARRYPGRPDRHPRRLQGRPADAVARQLVEIFDAQDATFVPLRSSSIRRARWGSSPSICRTPLISFDLFSTQRGTDGLLRLSTAVGWNERPGASRAPEYPAATQNQSTERQYPMPAPETRTEHQARAAAAAAKARAALTPRSTSSRQAHYGELRQKWACSRYTSRRARHFDLGQLLPRAEDPGLCQSCLTQFHALCNRLPHAKRSTAMQGAGNPVVPVSVMGGLQ
jgi:hypothetical protein